ncbi:Fe-S-containing protein [Lacrimispora sp.]|uniref:Fe-S-containing protein n=1 Tax=Lacrimispora sp. TaxID=2719234 RepID=UPI0028A71338|nr:Fe-S-containing protein [Lacrimispora sp.]
MLKYLIQVVQNLLTTGILLGMLFSLIHINNKQRQKKWLFSGFAAGVVSALILSFLKATTVLIKREYFNIGILSVAIFAEILFYMLSWGVLQKRAPKLYEKIWNIVNAVLVASLLLYSLPSVFLYPTEFVMTGGSIFGTDFLFKMIGYLGGLLIVGLAGFALYKVGMSSSVQLVRVLLTIGLAVNMVNQAATIVQFLLARRIIPMSKWLFGFIKIAVNYNDCFLYGIMAVTLLLLVVLWIKSLHPKETYTNPAQHRRIRATSRRQKRWCVVVAAGYILAVLCLTVVKAYDEKEVVLSPAEDMDIVGNEIVIPLENINDGHLHRYVYTASNGIEVRFIVIKKSAAAYGVGLDACDICGPTGYYERDDEVICKLCDVVMNKSTIGFKGGCNPVPLSYSLSGGNMVLQTQNLENEKSRFK